MNKGTFIAIDFGGGSGRVIAGSPAESGEVKLTEVHRFANGPVERDGLYYWDFDMLCREMLTGLGKAATMFADIVSVGVDTWGVDFGLIGNDGELCCQPLCYRNEVWLPMMDEAASMFGSGCLYERSGLQPIGFNSIYRLMWMKHEGEEFAGKRLLFMPDLFNYFLSGVACNEYTIASTSGLLNARSRQWDTEMCSRLGLPEGLFGKIVHPGEVIGSLRGNIARKTGLSEEVKVVAVGSHDTASAVNAIDTSPDTAFLSSGTWSLLGIELAEPITTGEAERSGYSNEGGTRGITFLQNITGLWILQQLVNQWREEGLPHDYPTLVAMATEAAAPSLIDVDDASFGMPGNMLKTIADYCISHGLTPPSGQGETVRCVLESLAARYKRGVEELARVTGHPLKRLHIIGGGSRNALLNDLTARATGLEIMAGPAEATAIGNIKTQIDTYKNS